MSNLTRTLLGGAALCALAVVPAVAQAAPTFHITSLHGGRVVNKTKLHNHGAVHITYTFGVYSTLSGSDPKKQRLNGSRLCPAPDRVRVTPKKTQYAKIGIYTQTYSDGCEFVAATYKLLNPPVQGTDNFVLSIASRFENNGTKYKGTLNLDYTVTLE